MYALIMYARNQTTKLLTFAERLDKTHEVGGLARAQDLT